MNNYKGIYGYWDLEKNEVVYVGKDSNMGKKLRYTAHKAPSKYGAQPFNKVLQNNPDRYAYYEICNLPMDATDAELNHYEKLYVAKYDPKFNFTSGGLEGCTLSSETKAKISEAVKGENHPMYGKTHTAEARKKISEAGKGRKLSAETIEKISGENHHEWKSYARIVKHGSSRGKQRYGIKYNGKIIKKSISYDKLVKYINDNNLPTEGDI